MASLSIPVKPVVSLLMRFKLRLTHLRNLTLDSCIIFLVDRNLIRLSIYLIKINLRTMIFIMSSETSGNFFCSVFIAFLWTPGPVANFFVK